MQRYMSGRRGNLCFLLCFVLVAWASTTHASDGDHTWDGEAYSGNKSIQYRGAVAQISAYPFTGREDILDLGAGDGELTALLAQNTHGHVVGLDADASMVAYANEHHGTGALRFVRGDIRALTYENAFDLVTSFNALHWLGEQRQALAGLHRALRPGGKILLGLPTVVPGENIGTSLMVALFRDVGARPRWSCYLRQFKPAWHFFGTADYTALLQEAGFAPLRVEITRRPFTLASRAAFMAWMRQISPHLAYIPAAEHDAFLGEVADAYLAHVPLGAAGQVYLSHAQLEVLAAK